MKKVVSLLLALAMALSLAACGGGSSNAPAADGSTPTAAGSGTAAPSGDVVAKTDPTVLNVYLASEPAYLDPALNSSVDGGCLAVNTFEGLMTYDAEENLIPACAENYEMSEDGTVYTFTMRDDLKWSNGEPLTANDFVYSWTRAADVNTAADYGYLYEVFANGQYDADGNFLGLGDGAVVASEDGKTLTVTLKAPCPYFLSLCAFPAFFPVYEPSVTAGNPDGTTPGGWAKDATDAFVCNGAYVLKSWNHDSDMTYVKNENWRNADQVSVETLNFMLSSDSTATYAAYQSGNLDFVDDVPVDELGVLMQAQDPELHIADNLGTYYVGFNYNSELWSNLGLDEEQAKVFRHALCLLVDRDYIIENIGQTGQEPANTFVPAACSDSNGGTFKNKEYFPVDDYDANVAEAIELMKSIGLEFDANNVLTTPISFTYLTNNSEGNVKMAESMQADFAQVGIEMKIDQQEWNVFLETRKNGDFDVAREGWLMDYNDPINMLEMWTTNSGNNDCQFGRDESKELDWKAYDKLIDDIRSCVDLNERVELMHQAEDILMDTWCVLPIYYYNDPYMMKDYMTGMFCNKMGFKYFYDVTLNVGE